jgi:hypothetical protein
MVRAASPIFVTSRHQSQAVSGFSHDDEKVTVTGIDIGIIIVGIMSITTGTIIAIGTTTGIATVATSTSMTTTRAKSEWASLNSLNFETIAFGCAS